MPRFAFSVLLAFALVAAFAHQATAEKRVALVVGNGAYENTGALPNPANDARDLAQTLQRLGFEVILGIDLNKQGMDDAFRRFARAMAGADAALFFYAGHGMQFQGVNYLMPVDARLEDEADLPYEMAKLDDILVDMGRVDGVRMAILDACRDNPLEQRLKRSIARTRNIAMTRGLAQITRTQGLLVAYATQPGDVADDGTGRNSPFTAALLEHVETPGLEVGPLFRRVGAAVNQATGGKQTPELSVSLLGEFYFKAGDPAPVAAAPAAPPSGPSAPSAPTAQRGHELELAFWNSIKDGSSAAAFQSYLDQFPGGAFAALARLKIAELEARAAASQQQAPQHPQQQAWAPGPAVILPHSSRSRLTAQDLAGLNCEQLWIARNEIFDRNGYCFQTPRGQAYFDNSDCTTSSQNILNATERANVTLIQSWETRQNCR